MAGTDHTKSAAHIATAPTIILVRPQLGENIGMCARAMLNCGVTDLRIVAPRDGWPSDSAISAASGAAPMLEKAMIYDDVAVAVADLEVVFATTARGRDLTKPVATAAEAAALIRQENGTGPQRCGILFGPERTGLENDDIVFADHILSIPLNPGFSSLNLAQAVLLVCYSWLSHDNPFSLPPQPFDPEDKTPAKKDEVENLLLQLEKMLDDSGFFRSAAHRPTVLRNLRGFFFRSGMTAQETRTMHGVLASLYGRRRRGEKD